MHDLELLSGLRFRLLPATTLAVCLSLGACADPPKPVAPQAPPVDDSRRPEIAEASRLEAQARALPPGKNDEALRGAYRAMEIRRRVLGDGHMDTWRTAELIADLHLRADQLDQAESALKFDLAARERARGPTSAGLAVPLGTLAEIAVKRRDYAAAEQLRRRALSVLEADLGPWNPDVALGNLRLGALLMDLCRVAEAEPLLQRALDIQARATGPASPDLAPAWRRLSEARWLANDRAGAESTLQKAIALLAGHEKDRGEALVDALLRLATMYRERQMPAEARAANERAVDIGERSLGTSNAAMIGATSSLWDLHRAAGTPEAGDKLLARLAIVRVERVRPGVTTPTPVLKETTTCVSAAASPAGTAAQPASVANASAVVAGMAAGFRRCYNLGLQKDASLSGVVRVTARVAATGEVASVHTFVPAGVMAQVAECVLDVTFQSRFAPPEGGGATIVIPVSFMTR